MSPFEYTAAHLKGLAVMGDMCICIPIAPVVQRVLLISSVTHTACPASHTINPTMRGIQGEAHHKDAKVVVSRAVGSRLLPDWSIRCIRRS